MTRFALGVKCGPNGDAAYGGAMRCSCRGTEQANRALDRPGQRRALQEMSAIHHLGDFDGIHSGVLCLHYGLLPRSILRNCLIQIQHHAGDRRVRRQFHDVERLSLRGDSPWVTNSSAALGSRRKRTNYFSKPVRSTLSSVAVGVRPVARRNANVSRIRPKYRLR